MSQQEKILITGASGFVGSAVARQLVDAGYSVRALVRGASPRAHLAGLGLEFSEGDLRDRKSVERATGGVRYVFHVAADYRLWARDRSEIFASNVEGTRNLMEAVLSAGVERVIHTSSVATIAVQPDGTAADESRPLREEQGIGVYKRSKIAAERLVEAMVAERGLPAVIVNPSTPIGPRDVKPTPTGRIIVEAAKGRIPAFIDTGLNLVHVDDVASGHLAALRHGRIGERYILGGQDVLFSQMLRDIAGLVGRRAANVRLPWRALIPVAFVAEAVANVTGREPFATRDGVHMAKHRMFFASGKAERELGYRSRLYTEGIDDAVRWFRNSGYLGS
ncbi:MAG TPA: hopanoid-associated sugar epimerase [Pseudolabrys sp.]|nr:hopanoid-associated sugar epimerase [Pseudolabrys sp.]